MRIIAVSAFASCLLVTACASPERSKLERGMAYAKREFLRAGRNPIAALSLGSVTQMGGNLSSYLYAAMPDKSDLPQFQDDQPSGPWSIALRATAGDSTLSPIGDEVFVALLGPQSESGGSCAR